MRGKLNRHGLAVLIIVTLITSLLVPTTGFVLADEATPPGESPPAPEASAPATDAVAISDGTTEGSTGTVLCGHV